MLRYVYLRKTSLLSNDDDKRARFWSYSVKTSVTRTFEIDVSGINEFYVLLVYWFFLWQEGKIAGRAVLLAGRPGTGKTAIAMG